MSNMTYTVTLPDGTTDSRKSARPYTHAVVVVSTVAERDARIARMMARADAEREIIRKAIPRLGAADRAAYDAALAQIAHLDEVISHPCENMPERMSPRWLTMGVAPGSYRSIGRTALDKAQAARDATARYTVDHAHEELASALRQAEHIERTFVVGECIVYGWSMSAKNVVKMVADARKRRPCADVSITTDIAVRVHGTRAKAV